MGRRTGSVEGIPYGEFSRAHDKVWGRDQATVLSRYLLPQLKGIADSKRASGADRRWAKEHLPALSGLHTKAIQDDA